MGYIRLKKVNSTNYAYYVETINTPKGPRQKVKQYLGRVFSFEHEINNTQEISGQNKKTYLNSLVQREIFAINLENIKFNTIKMSFVKGNKNIVLKLNDGFLTSFTINRLLNFKKSDDLNKDALTLANFFLQAGLTISEEEFVEFYRLV
jgi:hypothetical protein